MKKKVLGFLGGVFALALIVASITPSARAANTVQQAFNFTSPGQAAVSLSYSGQKQCGVQIYGPSSSMQMSVQAFSATTGLQAANWIAPGGGIQSAGWYSGIDPVGYTSIQISPVAFNGQQVSGYLTCGDSLPNPVPLLTPVPGSTPNYDSVVLKESSAVHFWKMADNPNGCSGSCTPGPCPSTMADSIGGGATANPSPVAMNVATPASSPWPLCGAAGIIKDGESSITNQNLTYQSFLFTIPSPVLSNLCNGNAGGACTNPLTIEAIVSMVDSSDSCYYLTDPTLGLLAWLSNAEVFKAQVNSNTITGVPENTSGTPFMIDLEYDGSANSSLYVNGIQTTTGAHAPAYNASTITDVVQGTASGSCRVRFEKLSLYNTALTQIDLLQHFQATGLP